MATTFPNIIDHLRTTAYESSFWNTIEYSKRENRLYPPSPLEMRGIMENSSFRGMVIIQSKNRHCISWRYMLWTSTQIHADTGNVGHNQMVGNTDGAPFGEPEHLYQSEIHSTQWLLPAAFRPISNWTQETVDTGVHKYKTSQFTDYTPNYDHNLVWVVYPYR